ncbi:MAG: hypothetical protein LBU37_09575 [Tannerellaceae bacterium]|jgi:hypothetical protein|nr:hypothetical protein [Tannerellaceae bacterium]
MADIKENEMVKVTLMDGGSYIRILDKDKNSVLIDKASFIEAIREVLPIATNEKKGLLGTIENTFVRGIFLNFFYDKKIIIDTKQDAVNDQYIMFEIKAISSNGYLTSATYVASSINNSGGFTLNKFGISDVIVKSFLLDNRIHLFVDVNRGYGNLYLRFISQLSVPTYFPAAQIPDNATLITESIDVS